MIESRLDKGKGPVSTILVTSGSLKKGDYLLVEFQVEKSGQYMTIMVKIY